MRPDGESPQDDAPQSGVSKAVVAALEAEIARLQADLKAAKDQITQLTAFADQDPLLPEVLNRRAFMREMSRIMSFAERYEIDAALIYFDLNKFKAINDTYGHGAGDKVLRVVGGVLLKNVRDSDLVGRLGGDEFAVVLAKADEDVVMTKAKELAHQVAEEKIAIDGGAIVSVGCSFGICPFKGKMDPEAAIKVADKAMYAMRGGAVQDR